MEILLWNAMRMQQGNFLLTHWGGKSACLLAEDVGLRLVIYSDELGSEQRPERRHRALRRLSSCLLSKC